jgi:transcriptional regulator GlxA family with amidase domain
MSARLVRIKDWEALAKEARFRPADMAALCPISLRHLERFFLGHFKQSPRLWATALRCRLARDLIAQGWSNRAVAIELNFADESQLCHTFQRLYGCTPQTFAPLYSKRTA